MQFRHKSRSTQLPVTVQGNKAKLWESRPLAIKLTTKSDISYVTRSIDVTSACSSFLMAGHETKGFHQISKLWDSRPLAVKVAA